MLKSGIIGEKTVVKEKKREEKVDEKGGREDGEVSQSVNLNLSSIPRRVFSSLLYL